MAVCGTSATALAAGAPPTTYRLDAADIEAISRMPAPKEGSGSPQPAPKVDAGRAAQPAAVSFGATLAPLMGVDYPSEDHFRTVLGLAYCAHAKGVGKIDPASGKGITFETACPEPYATPPEAGASASPAGRAAQGQTLPPDLAERLVKQARKAHAVDPNFDASWAPTEGCGCVPSKREDEVFAFIPHWGTTEQQQASPPGTTAQRVAAPRQTDFSLFSRLSFFGAMLDDKGDVEIPPAVRDAGEHLAQAAQRHGTRVDLVVHRDEWERLLRRPTEELTRLAVRAAESTMKRVDALPKDPHPMASALLLPFWREGAHSYAGVTVFFDNLPRDDSPLSAAFKSFSKAFVDALVARMQEGKRGYGLNIVVPDDRAAENGLFDFKSMQDLILRAEPRPRNKALHNAGLAYTGKTDIRVSHIVMLSDPTTRTKKAALRERLDRSSDVTGARRVIVLDSMVPMLLRPMAVKAPWALDDPARQFKDDLAYLSWTFGGAALWEPPGQAQGDPERLDMLAAQFRGEPARLGGLCDWVCPRRLWLRLTLQSLLALGALVLALRFASRAVRNRGLPVSILLWSLAVLAAPLTLAMLECDPVLEPVNERHAPLWLLAAALVLAALYRIFRSRQKGP